MPTPIYYAFSRQLNAGTGDRVFSVPLWPAGTPLTEIVVRTLRTAKGSYLPDPNFGLDLTVVNKASPNAGAMLEKAVRAALDYLVRAGLLTKLAVQYEVQGTAIVFTVTFVDPRTNKQDSVKRVA